MKKLGLFFVLIVSISAISEDEIYSIVVSLFKGMAKAEESECASVFINQKEKILEIIHIMIDDLNSGIDSNVAIQNCAIRLVGVEGLVNACNVLGMPPIFTKITSKDGLVDIFQICIDNIDDIFLYVEQIYDAFGNKDYNAVAEAFGHILTIALDFQVNF